MVDLACIVVKVTKLTGAVGLVAALLATSAPWANAAPETGPPLAAGRYAAIKVPGGMNAMAEGISDSGAIVGCDQRKVGSRGFVERNEKFTVLADPAAGAKGSTCAFSINSQGVIVGYYGSAEVHGFVLKGTRFTTLDEPQAGHKLGEGTLAVDLNDSGTIVGWYLTSKNVEHGFVLRHGKFTTINFPGHPRAKQRDTVLNGISDNGTITGIFSYGAGHQVSFTDRNGKFRPIAVPQAKSTSVACISEHSGLLVGGYLVAGSKLFRGFTFRHGVYRTLRASSGKQATLPQCGNDHGAVVGFLTSSADPTLSSAFLFTPGHGPVSPGTVTSPSSGTAKPTWMRDRSGSIGAPLRQ
jgi:uncharacterized membrane protein